MANSEADEEIKNRNEAFGRALQQFMEQFINPEVKRRRSEGVLPEDFVLVMAQIIFYPDGKPTEVRLNKEAKAVVHVRVKKGVEKGDQVDWDNVESIERAELVEKEDPDCGHVTMVRHNGIWHMSFDFVYYKGTKKILNVASEFLDGATFAKGKGHVSLFVDSLFSAAELISKAILILHSNEDFKSKTNHKAIKQSINSFARNGRLTPDQIKAINKLSGLRTSARYLEKKFSLSENEMNTLLTQTSSLHALAIGRLRY